ncbi:MAG: TIGR01777 family oxidoreductase, partial [Bacteroidota bacterium]
RRRKETIIGTRLAATGILVEAIGRTTRKPPVLVNASAVGYYGHVPEGDVTENRPAGDDFLAQTTQQWEAAALEAQRLGIRVVTIRTGFVLAPDAPAFRKMVLPFKLFAGGPYGNGKQGFPWVHIDDVAAAYGAALENPQLTGPVNVAGPENLTVKEFTRVLGKALHRPSWAPAPAFALRIVLGEMADLLLKGHMVVPGKLLDTGFTFRFPTAKDALEDVVAKM